MLHIKEQMKKILKNDKLDKDRKRKHQETNQKKKRSKQKTNSKRKTQRQNCNTPVICKNWISDDLLCNLQYPEKNIMINSFEQDPHAAVLVYHLQSGLLHEFEETNNDIESFFDDVDEAKEEEYLLTAIEKCN